MPDSLFLQRWPVCGYILLPICLFGHIAKLFLAHRVMCDILNKCTCKEILKWQCHDILTPFFHDCNHSGPLLMVQKLSSIVDTKESNSALSLTPQSQTPRGQWHCGVKHAVNNVAKKFSNLKRNFHDICFYTSCFLWF